MGRGPDYIDDGEREPSDRLGEIFGHLARITDLDTRGKLLNEARGLILQLSDSERSYWRQQLGLSD